MHPADLQPRPDAEVNAAGGARLLIRSKCERGGGCEEKKPNENEQGRRSTQGYARCEAQAGANDDNALIERSFIARLEALVHVLGPSLELSLGFPL